MRLLTLLFIIISIGLVRAQDSNVLKERYAVPEEYTRVESSPSSFACYLQNLELKTKGSKVYYHDGRIKDRPDVYCGVVDLDIGSRDLVQCADACMLLYGEYLYEQKSYNAISFDFVSDGKPRYYADYTEDRSYKAFRKYMNYVFAYANTRSLYHQLGARSIMDMQIGDVFIQTGNPYGHAVIVVDMAVNATTGEKVFILAQSYMPAQEIQILKNPRDNKLSPWYSLEDATIYTPEWTFKPEDLRHY